MILGFKEYFNNDLKRPTYFPEKILAPYYKTYTPGTPSLEISYIPKLHSIRKGNRWKSGNSIQMATGVRTKRYNQFNRRIDGLEKCISVQVIEIVYNDPNVLLKPMYVKVDGKKLNDSQIDILARNDGFESTQDFFNYFNEDFIGQIVHWTDLRY